MTNTSRILILFLVMIVCLGNAVAQTYDISTGGTPTLTGSLNGSVTGSSDDQSNLTVTVNFGELSPINSSGIVYVVVPIGIRSTGPYRVMAQVSGAANANLQAMRPSDIGLGLGNLRRLGSQSLICDDSSHIFYSPFTSDPATTVFLNPAGRAAYLASLENLSTATVIMSGPRLSGNNANRLPNNAWIFDAKFAITPQFYAPGTSTVTITFSISAGPNVPC